MSDTPRYRFSDQDHLHELCVNGTWKPLTGTTTAMNVLAKPLTWWAAGMAAAEFGWVHEREATPLERHNTAVKALEALKTLNAEAYLKKLDKAYRAHDQVKRSAAVDGTDIHSRLERYVLRCLNTNAGKPLEPPETVNGPVKVFAAWARNNVERFMFAESHCYSETLWTGGICDAGAILEGDGRIALVDFKRSKAAYFSHFVQLAGYAWQIDENGLCTAEGKPVFESFKPDTLIVFPFGGGKVRSEPYNTDMAAAFCSVITLYRTQQQFDAEETKL